MTCRPFSRLYQKLTLTILTVVLSIAANSTTDESVSEKRIGIALRMIGHEILMCLGDDESRVLPIEKVEEQEGFTSYRISFEFEFGFDPSDIVVIIDRVMNKAKIASDYLVQVEQCQTKEVMHSFEIRNAYPDLIPCAGRILPKDCYSLLITLFESNNPIVNMESTALPGHTVPEEEQALLSTSAIKKVHPLRFALWIVPLLILIGFTHYYFRRKTPVDSNPNLISIGVSQFDKRNRTLSFQDQTAQLSHKEASLLALLHSAANQPIEREILLQKVWGDEGDYIGRTLDVFISKLRKKLEADSSVKIVNIRGVGYKLEVG